MRQRRFLVLVLVLAAAGTAADWPRFRGPNGTGTASDADVPVRWTAADGVLWKAALPGIGHSSPVIAAGRVFLQSASEDGRDRWLLCLDAASGKVLWKAPSPGRAAHTHVKNSLASSTPAADAKRAYVVFWDGRDVRLAAYDFEGKRVWASNLGAFRSQHGPGFSPMVVGTKVIVTNDQDGAAALLAFDGETGKPAWQSARQAYRACYSTPFLRERPTDGPELVVVSTAGVTGYEPETGKESWNCTWPPAKKPLRTVSSPVLADGVIVATAGDGDGSRLAIGVQPPGPGGATDPKVLWEDRKSFPYVPSPLAHGKHIYAVTDAGMAGCFVARSGEPVWQERLRGEFAASPILVDGKVYAVSTAGDVFVFAATTTFKLLARNPLGEAVSASPAVAENRLYVRGREHLFCIGKLHAGENKR